jgi:hypothetical protein
MLTRLHQGHVLQVMCTADWYDKQHQRRDALHSEARSYTASASDADASSVRAKG